jgi:hypothetical protein
MIKKTKIRNRLNWRIITGDLKEAREQIEEIEKSIHTKKYPDEVELQLMLEHAYRHLNFAWNTRRVTTKNYANLTGDEFNKWSQFPKGIKIYTLPKKRKKKNS